MKQITYHLLMLVGCMLSFLTIFSIFQLNHSIQYSLSEAYKFTGLYVVYWIGYTILLNCLGTFKK